MTDGPLIVQSDKTVLLEVDHEQAGAARAAIAPFAEAPPTANAPAPTTGLAFSLEVTLMSEVFEMFAVPVIEDSTVAPNTVAAMDAPTATPPPEAVTVAASTFG